MSGRTKHKVTFMEFTITIALCKEFSRQDIIPIVKTIYTRIYSCKTNKMSDVYSI